MKNSKLDGEYEDKKPRAAERQLGDNNTNVQAPGQSLMSSPAGNNLEI